MKRLYNPIAIYNYNRGKYFIALDDGKIVYFKYENGEMSNDYSREELEVFYDVYNSLKVDKEKASNLGIRKFNGKYFETFYDIKKELYFWYEIIDGQRRLASKDDLELLNYKYNNQCLTFFEDNEGFGNGYDENDDPYDWEAYSYFDMDGTNPEDNHPEIYDWATDPSFNKGEMLSKAKTFKRGIIKAGKTIAIIVVAGVELITLSDRVLHGSISEKVRDILTGNSVSDQFDYEEIEKQGYNFEIIEKAIRANENLSDEEKSFFLKSKPYFDDMGEYIDLKTVIDRLANLKVNYTTEECKSPNIAGEYSSASNVITMYKTDSFENSDKSVLLHEFFHVTQKGFSKRLMMELSDEAATREYIRNLAEDGKLDKSSFMCEYDVPIYGLGYDQCMKVYYLLANLLDEDTIKKYQVIPADNILMDALAEIENNADAEHTRSYNKFEINTNAIELLDYIDELRTEPDEYGYRDVSYTDEKFKKICDLLDYYYQVKFGKTIDECFVEDIMSYDKTYGAISTDDPKGRAICSVMGDALKRNVENLNEKYKMPVGECRFVIPRTYFSDRYKNPIIYFNTYQRISDTTYNGFFVDIEITPEMNEEYEKQFKIAQEEIAKEVAESGLKENSDNIGGMGSIDIERD